MNKKILIKKATLLLKQYKELEDCQRKIQKTTGLIKVRTKTGMIQKAEPRDSGKLTFYPQFF